MRGSGREGRGLVSPSRLAASPSDLCGVIAGIGVDLIEIDRFRARDDLPELLRQVLSRRGLSGHAGLSRDASLGAALFATKEAVLKAPGCGLNRGSFWREVEIAGDFPATLSGGLKQPAEKQKVKAIRVVGSRSGRQAIAIAQT